MRILVVTNMFPSETSARRGIFVAREVEALRERGHNILVLFVDVGKTRSAYFRDRTGVRRACEEFCPDLVHVHFGLTLAAIPAGIGLPVVGTFHGSDLAVWWKRFVSVRLGRRLAQAIVVSSRMRATGHEMRVPLSVVPCGVVPSTSPPLDSRAARSRLGLPDGICLLFPSSPSRQEKRYDLFLQTVARVPGAYGVTLDEVDPLEVPVWLAASDCVVLTSAHEGSPVVTKEAVCAGTRVVSVNVGDVSEQFDGLSGCIVVDAAPEALAAAILAVLKTPGPDIGSARMRFDVGIEASLVESVYMAALKGPAW